MTKLWSSSPVMEYSWNVVKLASEVAPIPRRYFTVVTHEDRFYFFGGHKPSKEATNDFSVFDPSQFPHPTTLQDTLETSSILQLPD